MQSVQSNSLTKAHGSMDTLACVSVVVQWLVLTGSSHHRAVGWCSLGAHTSKRCSLVPTLGDVLVPVCELVSVSENTKKYQIL